MVKHEYAAGVTDDTQIELVDPATGAVEWAGTWSEFVAANDQDTLDEINEFALANIGAVYIGGGASPEVCIRLAVRS